MPAGVNDLDFLINELSLDNQFKDIASFEKAFEKIFVIRKIIKERGEELYCYRGLINNKVLNNICFYNILNEIDLGKKRSIMAWISKAGPFWDDKRRHPKSEWFEYPKGEIITESSIAESAYFKLEDIEKPLISFSPSLWEIHPLEVIHIIEESQEVIKVKNFWEIKNLKIFLDKVLIDINSWSQLKESSDSRWKNLYFSNGCFDSLKGIPFSKAASKKIISLLDVLNNFKACFDDSGNRTKEGQNLYRDFFTGKKGKSGSGQWFSDSSEREKHKFNSSLTFHHPEKKGETLFCPWHGKVQTPQLRLHFSWPVKKSEPLYIVYIGSKLTKK